MWTKGWWCARLLPQHVKGFVTNGQAAFHRGAQVSGSKFSFPSPTHPLWTFLRFSRAK